MDNKQKIFVLIAALLFAGILVYIFVFRDAVRTKKVEEVKQHLEKQDERVVMKNEGPVSPISGLPCDNWDRRPIAVMQPADIQARPAAGFTEADMVIEMPAFTASATRLMGVYLCNVPEAIGAIRSSRHDYIHLAKGLDATFVHWGGSAFAYNQLNKGVIDNIDCMNSPYCDRWEKTGKMRQEDTGHIKSATILEGLKQLGFERKGKLEGYPHMEEAAYEDRPEGGHLRVAFSKPYDAEYDYDRETNSFLRTWGEDVDTDRNTGERVAPKNIVVMIAKSEQITTSQQYTEKGLDSPWEGIPEIKSTGVESISGRYNNVQIGDPWYDSVDSGEMYYYMNGKEYRGQWKKDSGDINSKLFFYDQSGREVAFVPGQIWVEVLEPGQSIRWTTGESMAAENKEKEDKENSQSES